MSKRCAVYELYDGKDCLLYVGASCNPPRRYAEHQKMSPWFFGVAYSKVDWFDTREQAEREEYRRIGSLSPVFNVDGNYDPSEPPEWWNFYLKYKSVASFMASDKRVDIESAWKMAESLEKAEATRAKLDALMSQ